MRARVSSLRTASGLWWLVVDTLHRPFPDTSTGPSLEFNRFLKDHSYVNKCFAEQWALSKLTVIVDTVICRVRHTNKIFICWIHIFLFSDTHLLQLWNVNWLPHKTTDRATGVFFLFYLKGEGVRKSCGDKRVEGEGVVRGEEGERGRYIYRRTTVHYFSPS